MTGNNRKDSRCSAYVPWPVAQIWASAQLGRSTLCTHCIFLSGTQRVQTVLSSLVKTDACRWDEKKKPRELIQSMPNSTITMLQNAIDLACYRSFNISLILILIYWDIKRNSMWCDIDSILVYNLLYWCWEKLLNLAGKCPRKVTSSPHTVMPVRLSHGMTTLTSREIVDKNCNAQINLPGEVIIIWLVARKE